MTTFLSAVPQALCNEIRDASRTLADTNKRIGGATTAPCGTCRSPLQPVERIRCPRNPPVKFDGRLQDRFVPLEVYAARDKSDWSVPSKSFSNLLSLMEEDPELVDLLDRAVQMAGVASRRELIKMVRMKPGSGYMNPKANEINIQLNVSLEGAFGVFVHELVHYVEWKTTMAFINRDLLEFKNDADFISQWVHLPGGEFKAYSIHGRALRRLEKKYVIAQHWADTDRYINCNGDLVNPLGLEASILEPESPYGYEAKHYKPILRELVNLQYQREHSPDRREQLRKKFGAYLDAGH